MKFSPAQQRSFREVRSMAVHQKRNLDRDRIFYVGKRCAQNLVRANLAKYIMHGDEKADHGVYEWGKLVQIKAIVELSSLAVNLIQEYKNSKVILAHSVQE